MGTHGAQRVVLRFCVQYDTVWGESLVLSGGRGLLGEWDVHRGIRMACSQTAEGCAWHCAVDVPLGYESMYTYVVINEAQQVVHKEVYPHSLAVPETAAPGDVLQISDSFQARRGAGSPGAARALTPRRRPCKRTGVALWTCRRAVATSTAPPAAGAHAAGSAADARARARRRRRTRRMCSSRARSATSSSAPRSRAARRRATCSVTRGLASSPCASK